MATKLEKFLADNGIDQRRLVAASHQIERLRAEDRHTRLSMKQARKSEDGKKPEGLAKPRSGRPVTDVSLRKALAGKDLSGATKTRILRAVNKVLEQRKKGTASLADLFDAPKPGAKKAAASEE
jgi:hypothetical protein